MPPSRHSSMSSFDGPWWPSSARRARVLGLALLVALLVGHAGAACAPDAGPDAPMALEAGGCIEGALDGARIERAFELEVADDGRTIDIVATVPAPADAEVCLDVGTAVQCRWAVGVTALPDLALAAGRYAGRLIVAGEPGTPFRVDAVDGGPVAGGREREPNDGVATATLLGSDLAAVGVLRGREVDVFRAEVTGAPQLWRVQVVGAGVESLRYLDASGRVLQERRPEPGAGFVRASNLLLMPGPHVFAIEGMDSEYALRLVPLGPAGDAAEAAADTALLGPPMVPDAAPDLDALRVPLPEGPRPVAQMEREPNDDAGRAHLIAPGETWSGLLADAGDRDLYRFSLGEEAYLRFTVVPPPGAALDVDASGTPFAVPAGQPYVYDAWFLAGDHVVTLRAQPPADGYYVATLERLDPFVLPVDLEPNDEAFAARPLPADRRVVGTVGGPGGTDWYRLPAFDRPTTVVLDVRGDGVDVAGGRSVDAQGIPLDIAYEGQGRYRAEVPAGGPFAFRLVGGGVDGVGYEVAVAIGDEAPAPLPEATGLRLALEGAVPVAAYHPWSQDLRLTVEVTNDGATAAVVALTAHVTDHGWSAAFDAPTVALAAGATERLPLRLRAWPVARDDAPMRLTVAARAGDGPAATAAVDVPAVCGLPPVAPSRAWRVPERLLGGLNVAWVGLGSDPGSSFWRDRTPYDGLTPPGEGWVSEVGGQTTVRLAGDGPVLVAGVLLHPLGEGRVAERLADFRVLVSLDGVSFEPVLDGRLRSPAVEQAFVFERPVEARHVRLEVRSRQDGDPRGAVYLGEFKVVALPTAAPVGVLDLAARPVGGHVVHADPYLPTYAFDPDSDGRLRTARLADGATEASWVLGFHHGRAAIVEELRWHAHPAGDAAQRLEAVNVSVSTSSPLGPWTPLGAWRPSDAPTWALPDPTWVRYLRFDATGLAAASAVEYPQRVEVRERAPDADYRSAVGEWGHYGRDAVLEWTTEGRFVSDAPAASATREHALPLERGVAVEGRASLDAYDAWFVVDVPAGEQQLVLRLSGDPALEVRYEVTDDAGRPLPFAVDGDLRTVRLTVDDPPARVFLHAWEPPRAVVFAWDDSGSMEPYVDATYQTVLGFARGVRGDREAVQLLAFGDAPSFLLGTWSGSATDVIRTLIAHDRSARSSAAEANLAFAVEALGARDGSRSVLLVTDAESDPTETTAQPLWGALDAVRPSVFAFETSTAASDHAQDRMQDWAAAGGGFYEYSRTLGDLDVAFARVACLLRQPKTVRVVAWPESTTAP